MKFRNVRLFLFGLIAVAGMTTGCATMEGLGKDIKKADEQLEEAADKN